jgi:hypothetical protein
MTSNESENTVFFQGREFSSFEEINREISEYEKRFFVNLYIRSSRSIESAKRRAPNKVLREDLQFSELDFFCKEGGRKIVSKSKRCYAVQSDLCFIIQTIYLGFYFILCSCKA